MVASLRTYKGVDLFLKLAARNPSMEFLLVSAATPKDELQFRSQFQFPEEFHPQVQCGGYARGLHECVGLYLHDESHIVCRNVPFGLG